MTRKYNMYKYVRVRMQLKSKSRIIIQNLFDPITIETQSLKNFIFPSLQSFNTMDSSFKKKPFKVQILPLDH